MTWEHIPKIPKKPKKKAPKVEGVDKMIAAHGGPRSGTGAPTYIALTEEDEDSENSFRGDKNIGE